MTISKFDLEAIQKKLAPLLGQKPWGAVVSQYEFINFEFGNKIQNLSSQEVTARDRGEWRLLIYCSWRIEKNNEMLVGSFDEVDDFTQVRQVEGKSLVSVELFRPLWDTRFIFEDDLTLHTFSVSSQEQIHWQLLTSDDNVLTIGPGSSWSYTRESEFLYD